MRLQQLLDSAAADAAALLDAAPRDVAFVTSSYDTDFEPVADQVAGKVAQLRAAFGDDGPVRWSLWIVDDLPPDEGFTAAVREGFSRSPSLAHRLHTIPIQAAEPEPDGLKGRAILDGMAAARAAGAKVVVYINLNLKVDPLFAAPGLCALFADECDAAIGTRAPEDGGVVVGAGKSGRIKSRVYSRLARTLLPPLSAHRDTNAPLKLFNARAADCLIERAELLHVTLDCEWLMLMYAGGFRVAQHPIAWVQRPGSRPPWHLVVLAIRDAAGVRRRWQAGAL